MNRGENVSLLLIFSFLLFNFEEVFAIIELSGTSFHLKQLSNESR